MEWFQGSIGEAIQTAKVQKALFVVVVHGKYAKNYYVLSDFLYTEKLMILHFLKVKTKTKPAKNFFRP